MTMLAGAVWGAGAADGGTCGPTPSDAAFYQRMVTGRTDGWLGADSTGHIDLGDGRILWLYGDSHWGTRNRNGSYAAGWRFVANSVTVQDGQCTVAQRPFRDVVEPSAGADLYWPNDGWVDGDDVYVVFTRIEITGGSLFSFRSVGRDLVRLDRATLAVEARSRVPGDREWGSSVERVGNALYWWGRSFTGDSGDFHLARSSVLLPLEFEYRTPDGWTTDPAAATPVHRRGQTSNASFHHLPDGRWAAVYKDHELFGTGIIADVAANPWGPFAHMGRIATAAPRTKGAAEFTYAGTIHPGIGWDEGRLLVHWSHNSLDGRRITDGTVRYQPTFASVPTAVLSRPEGYAQLARQRNFVVGAHRIFTGAKPTGARADHWANELNFGIPRSSLTTTLARSDPWIGARIDDVHQRALGRIADPATRLRWTDAIQGGQPFRELAAHVYGSEEFFLRAGATNRGFVAALYRTLLGRAPDRAGLDTWTGRIDRGTSRAQVVRVFWASAEGRSVRADDLYRTLLGRTADPAGRTALAAALGGDDDLAAAAGLATSAEFFARANRLAGADR
jgi:hypothetical protein